jgi:hypothetical protein
MTNKKQQNLAVVRTVNAKTAKKEWGQPGSRKNRKIKRKQARKQIMPQYVIARTNPFDDDALGVKVPDDNLAPSATTLSRYDVLGYADGNSIYANLFTPDPSGTSFVPTSSTAAGVLTWAANWTAANTVSNIAAIRGSLGLLRPVAWGLRASCLYSPNNAQGRVHVCLVGVDYSLGGINGSAPTTSAAMKLQPGYFTCMISEIISDSLILVGKPTDNGAYRYRSTANQWLATAGNMEDSSGWYGIMILVEGAIASTNCLRIEVVAHYEGLPLGTTGALIEATPAAPHQPLLMAATENTVAVLPVAHTIDDAHDSFVERVVQAWDKAVAFATTIGQYASTAAKFAELFI